MPGDAVRNSRVRLLLEQTRLRRLASVARSDGRSARDPASAVAHAHPHVSSKRQRVECGLRRDRAAQTREHLQGRGSHSVRSCGGRDRGEGARQAKDRRPVFTPPCRGAPRDRCSRRRGVSDGWSRQPELIHAFLTRRAHRHACASSRHERSMAYVALILTGVTRREGANRQVTHFDDSRQALRRASARAVRSTS